MARVCVTLARSHAKLTYAHAYEENAPDCASHRPPHATDTDIEIERARRNKQKAKKAGKKI